MKLDIDHATWAVSGTPCCSATCFNLALAVQGEEQRNHAARDVPVGTSWAFRDHRNMAQVMRDEGGFDVVA